MNLATARPLSPSSVGKYLSCGEAYRREYVEGEAMPPGLSAHRGTGVHAAAEASLRALVVGGEHLSEDACAEAAVRGYDAALKERGARLSAEEEADRSSVVTAMRERTADCARAWRRDLAPRLRSPGTGPDGAPLIEVPWSLEVRVGRRVLHLRGRIDAIDEGGKVIELKTRGKRAAPDADRTSIQTVLYSRAAESLTGKPCAGVEYHVVLDHKRPVGEVVEATPTEADVRRVGHLLSAVVEGLREEHYPPAPPGAWWCSRDYCGYHATCRYGGGA